MTATQGNFSFPEIYSFPPFFTRQPNGATWKEQRRLWCDLLLQFYRHHHLFTMTLADAINEPPFNNRQLHRCLRIDMLQDIVDELVRQGSAVWTGAKGTKNTCLIYWRNPESWATLIHQWVSDRGLLNTVMTVFELTNDDETTSQGMYEPTTLILGFLTWLAGDLLI